MRAWLSKGGHLVEADASFGVQDLRQPRQVADLPAVHFRLRQFVEGALRQFHFDTGASDTMFDLGMIQSMGLQPVQSAALNILGCAEVRLHETYDVDVALIVPGESPRWVPLTILGGAVYATGAVAALGRDFLRHVVFTYDGLRQQAKLQW